MLVHLAVAAALGLSPVSAPPSFTYAYTVSGSTHVAAAPTEVAFGPTTLTVDVDTTDGHLYGGSLPVAPTRAYFRAGTQRAAVTITFTETTPVSGGPLVQAGTATGFHLGAHYAMRLSNFTLGGHPLALGPDCHSSKPVFMTAATDATNTYQPGVPVTMSGTYRLPAFTDCKQLTPFVNRTIQGPGNTIALVLTDGHRVS